MVKWYFIRPLPGNVIGTVFFVSILLLQIATGDVEAPTLQYIARHLLPDECQIIINHEVAEPISNPYKSPSNAIDCFRKLVGWSSNLRMNRRDTQLELTNRLIQIGRNDLATYLVGPSSRGRAVTEETIEYESWDSKKDGNRKLTSSSTPKISKINTLINGPSQIKSLDGLSSEPQQQSISSFPEVRRLTGIHSADLFKDRDLVMAEPESVNPVSSASVVNVTADPVGQHQTRKESAGTSSTTKVNDGKDLMSSSTVVGKIPEDKKRDKSKFPRILPHFSDEKTSQCLRVPLSAALAVIGTIMILTCCCALLLRNRLVACFERLRRKKPAKPISKRMSTDEEQGFMGPRTVGKPPKRSGRKGGGPTDVTNVGVQNTNGASNVSGESEEKLTGCCNCCARKKKKSRRKWKK